MSLIAVFFLSLSLINKQHWYPDDQRTLSVANNQKPAERFDGNPCAEGMKRLKWCLLHSVSGQVSLSLRPPDAGEDAPPRRKENSRAHEQRMNCRVRSPSVDTGSVLSRWIAWTVCPNCTLIPDAPPSNSVEDDYVPFSIQMKKDSA